MSVIIPYETLEVSPKYNCATTRIIIIDLEDLRRKIQTSMNVFRLTQERQLLIPTLRYSKTSVLSMYFIRSKFRRTLPSDIGPKSPNII